MSKQIIIASTALLLALIFAAAATYLEIVNPAPMTGWVDNKTYHPAYYPVDSNTPWVYVLGITSTDGRRATTWIVSQEVYESYSVGDLVKRGRR